MRRVKSAPANLALMANNKKTKTDTTSILIKKNYLLHDYNENLNKNLNKNLNNNLNLDKNKDKNNILYLNKYTEKKNLKNKFIDIGDYISEITNDIDSIPVEETSIISAIILYISQNLLKKEKLKELNNFLLKFITKYIIMYYFHVYILHDDSYYLLHFSNIFNSLNVLSDKINVDITDTIKYLDKPPKIY